MPGIHYADDVRLSEAELSERVAPLLLKFVWFEQGGYRPHYYQLIFHTFRTPEGHLCRFRHLVAGRRGGKTLSAAWEVAYYVTHPTEFHWDAHGEESDEPLHIWILTKDHVVGRQALLVLRNVFKKAGLRPGIDYKENRGQRYFEFPDGGLIEFRTADDPESLVGAGLDILWMDEAAKIVDAQAYNIARPALSDKLGIVLTTTTPKGKNWVYDEFWNDVAKNDTNQGRVEFRSIDSPYFSREEWELMRQVYHPLFFRRELMASFDSMSGNELSGDWLHYYTNEDLSEYKTEHGTYDLAIYIGVDPAVSLSDQADYFVLTVIGVTKDNSKVFLLEQVKDRIPFPEQVELILRYHRKWRPMLIGVESTAYQAALAQQLERFAEFPPILPVDAPGKKAERILGMSPLFKIGKVLIRAEHHDFIEEWVDYDSQLKNPKDDSLDSMEIALRTAGALLPELPTAELIEGRPAANIQELAERKIPKAATLKEAYWDDDLGADW